MRLPTVVSAVSLAAVCAATAVAGVSPGVGSNGGDHARASQCPEGAPLVGFSGGAGHLYGMKLVGRIRAVCAQGGRRNTIGGLGAAGDDRRTPNEVHRCPRRTRAVGMRARGGELVDRVRLICRRFNRSGEPTGSRRYTGAIGGRGGTARSLMCPRGEYATGFAGSLRRGDTDVIDWLRLSCA